jgi:NAD(P)-dependent dehydrogenase (short-subunit alcohol dehydrogenase family)
VTVLDAPRDARPRLVLTGGLRADALRDEVAIVTGAGGGIGFEAARSLALLGARVVIAEIDAATAEQAARSIVDEIGSELATSIPTDVGDEAAIAHLVTETETRFGRIDVVVNNATFAPTGDAVWETPVEDWDRSYRVNVRGPALLGRACLPGMIARGHGTFVLVSSTGGPYQSAYESMKAAQVSIAAALDAELAETGVRAFTIGPGLVPTQTALAAVERLLPRLGLSEAEFLQMTASTRISVEAAGAGFAAAVAMSERYAGQEISSTQALIDAGIALPDEPTGFDTDGPAATMTTPDASDGTIDLATRVRTTLAEQADGWRRRSFFERQWMLRDFKQRVGMPVEACLEGLVALEGALRDRRPPPGAMATTVARLAAFYGHLADLARGYVKDATEREEQVRVVDGWREDADRLAATLAG